MNKYLEGLVPNYDELVKQYEEAFVREFERTQGIKINTAENTPIGAFIRLTAKKHIKYAREQVEGLERIIDAQIEGAKQYGKQEVKK